MQQINLSVKLFFNDMAIIFSYCDIKISIKRDTLDECHSRWEYQRKTYFKCQYKNLLK